MALKCLWQQFSCESPLTAIGSLELLLPGLTSSKKCEWSALNAIEKRFVQSHLQTGNETGTVHLFVLVFKNKQISTLILNRVLCLGLSQINVIL